MGKTLETKKKILNLLQKKEMTVTELSRELDLSTATVSQHMDELRDMGAVEKIDNEHFKKMKYYKRSEAVNMNMVKYVVGVLVIIGALSLVYLYAGHARSPSTGVVAPESTVVPNTTYPTSSNNTNSTTPLAVITGGGGLACPMITYQTNGTVTSSFGLFVYYLNSSNGKVPDYVIGSQSSGVLYAKEIVSGVLDNNATFTSNRTHYARLTQINSTNMTAGGLNMSISPQTYNAVNNTEMNLTITLITNQTPAKNTYWLTIDGPCGGGVTPVLVTVGNKPYNGTVTESASPYA